MRVVPVDAQIYIDVKHGKVDGWVHMRHAHWEDVDDAPYNLHYATCSYCKKRQMVEVMHFCPNCGSDMREPENEID